MTFEYRDPFGNRLEAEPSDQAVKLTTYWSYGDILLDIPLDRVEEVVAGIRDAARTASGQQPETTPCACTHPQDRHLSACTECPCIGYAPTWPPTKRRIVPVCDQCGAPWAISHRCAPAPAVGQPAEAHDTDEAELTDNDRAFLTFALDRAADVMTSCDGFTDADDVSLARLRRLAAESAS